MRGLIQDIRYGLRNLRRNPGFAAVAGLVLALGIGANTAVFSLINAILLRPPVTYRDPSQLVFLWERSPQGRRAYVSVSAFLDWRTHTCSFDDLTAVQGAPIILTGGDQPERIPVGRISASFFHVLGVQPALGRAFLPEEHRPGAPGAVILSHAIWSRRFGGDPGVIGRPITLDDRSYVVAGVMPSRFRYHTPVEAFVPADLDGARSARDARTLTVIARLKPGVSLEQARAEMDGIARNLASSYPDSTKDWGVQIDRLHEYLVRGPSQDLPVLMGAALFVLLIACANVANLLLAKAAGRRHEMAVRAALGAGRARLLRQLLVESIVLAVLASVVGVLLAVWVLRGLMRMLPPELAVIFGPIPVDLGVLAFTLAVSVLTGVIFGLTPGWRASKLDLHQALKQAGRSPAGASGGVRMRGGLVIAEMALCLVLLVGASVMLRAFVAVTRAEPGFDPRNLLTFQISLPRARYAQPDRVQRFFRQALQRLEILPGARSAALSSSLPFSGGSPARPFEIVGRSQADSVGQPAAQFVAVTEGYFRTLGFPLRKGRPFTAKDDDSSAPAAIVNESFVRRFLPNQEPLGQRLRLPPAAGAPVVLEIVGVTGDLRAVGVNPEAAPALIYVPYWQNASPDVYVCLRAASDPMHLAPDARAAIHSVDRDQPVSDLRTMEQVRARAFTVPRILTAFTSGFGLLALLLAVIGLYGLMSYSVTQRAHEIGIRTALGATPRDLLRLVLRRGATLTFSGLLIGLAGAILLTRLLRGMLFGVPAFDPALLAGVSALLLLVGLCACYFPARRAASADPAVALRFE